jgi:hypothetical protein
MEWARPPRAGAHSAPPPPLPVRCPAPASTNWVPVAAKLYKAASDAAPAAGMMVGPDWSDPNIPADKLKWCAAAAAPAAAAQPRAGDRGRSAAPQRCLPVHRPALGPPEPRAHGIQQLSSAPRAPAGPCAPLSPCINPRPGRWLGSVHDYLGTVSVHLYGGDVVNDRRIDTILADKRMARRDGCCSCCSCPFGGGRETRALSADRRPAAGAGGGLSRSGPRGGRGRRRPPRACHSARP